MADDDKTQNQPAREGEGVSSPAPAEGGDDTSPPTEGSPKG
jgi:hypothetical protein